MIHRDHSYPRPHWRWSWMAALLLFAFFAWPSIRVLGGVYAVNPDYAHGPLVVAVAILTAWDRQRKSIAGRLAGAPVCGLLLAFLGVITVVAGRWYEVALRQGGLAEPLLGGLGLIAVLAGWVLVAGGPALLRHLAFPLGYLLCAVPWPVSLTDPLTLSLRKTVAAAAAGVLRGMGFFVYREGNLLHLPEVTLGVVDACSGLRSFWVLVAVALALAGWMRMGWKRGLVLTLAALPVSMAANLLRVVVTAVLAARVDPRMAGGLGHEAWGLLVFAVGATVLTALAWRWKPASTSPAPPAAADLVPARGTVLALALVMLLGGLATLGLHYHYPFGTAVPPRRLSFDRFPHQVGDFLQVSSDDILPAQLQMLQADDRLVRTYRGPDGRTVRLWALYWAPVRSRWAVPVTGPHRPEVCYPAAGWRRVPSLERLPAIHSGGFQRLRLRAFRRSGRTRLVLYTMRDRAMLGWHTPEALAARLRTLLQTLRDPVRIHASRYIVAVETDVTTGTEAARNRLMAFAGQAARHLPDFDIAFAAFLERRSGF